MIIGGCTETFDPPRGNYENLLVVDALISDENIPQVIKISRSHPIDTSQFIVESGATVYISDDNNIKYPFSETTSGNYQTELDDFTPVIGTTYTLNIATRDGQTYQSKPAKMR